MLNCRNDHAREHDASTGSYVARDKDNAAALDFFYCES